PKVTFKDVAGIDEAEEEVEEIIEFLFPFKSFLLKLGILAKKNFSFF
ncbi:unnamed protein product, partial [marine sediment metagenome]